MAYTIISQNNTTTTLADENGNVITVPARVTLATSTDYTIIKVNNNSVDLEDGDGKIIRGVPACVVLAGEGGGGGGDQHNLGYYATQAALEEAHPTAEAGDWAIVGATDTVWIWDTDTSAWVDSDQKGQVVSVNSKTGTVVLTAEDVDALPQYSTMPVASSSNSGSVVQYTGTTNANYTNGYFYKCTGSGEKSATASQTSGSGLTDIAVNIDTFETQISVSGSYNFMYDDWESVWKLNLVSVDLTDYGITYTGTPVDYDTITVVYSAGGGYAWIQTDVQPTPDPLPSQTGQNGKFLTTNGTTASWSDNLTKVNTTATLAVADWSSNTQTVTVSGVKADSVVFVSPAPASASDYASAGILCTAQAADSLTFTCTTTPTNAITVNVICM